MWWRTWIPFALVSLPSLARGEGPPATQAVARFPLEEPLPAEPPIAIVVDGPVGAFPDVDIDPALALLKDNPYPALLAQRLSEIALLGSDPRLESPYAEQLNRIVTDDAQVGSLENPYTEALRFENPYRSPSRGTE